MDLHSTLIHAVTRYDRRQETLAARNPRRYYNRYALAQYMMAADRVIDHMRQGFLLVDALFAVFNGRLLDRMLKAVSDKPRKTA